MNLRVLAIWAAAILALTAGAVAWAGQGPPPDIKGPLGPMRYPAWPDGRAAARAGRRVSRRAAAGVLAAGFAAVAFCFLLRRRRRLSRQMEPAPIVLRPDLEDLPAGEFYAELLRAVREGLALAQGRHALAMTPREMFGIPLPVDAARGSARQRWRELCERAELAEYSGAEIPTKQRSEDLDFVEELTAWFGAGMPRGEAPHGV
jgi:hypothetical protein